MVEKYQKKHFFILNVNLFALAALREHRQLGRVVTSTILLTPMADEALIRILLERHQIGGLDLVFRGESNPYHTLAFRRHLKQFAEESHGNIGTGFTVVVAFDYLWYRS